MANPEHHTPHRHHRPRRKPPLGLQLWRLFYRTAGRVAPRATAHLTYRLWVSTRRYPTPSRELRWLENAKPGSVQVGDLAVATYEWGEGEPVLLVHGWNGRGSQLGAFAQPLTQAGYRVIAFDGPGHGQTPGTATNLFQFTAVLQAVAARQGPLAGVIAHSFGAPCTALALKQGLKSRCAVVFSPPARMDELAEKFARFFHIPSPVVTAFKALMETQYGADVWENASTESLVSHLTTPAMVFHDCHDEDVPWQEGERVAKAWPGARFTCTEGLGHRRILRNAQVLQQATTFLDAHHTHAE